MYEHKLVTADGLTYPRSFIVIKNSYGVIIQFTRLHDFVGAYESRVYRPLASDAKEKLYYICRMLNYVLIDHYSIYRIDHVFKVTKDMLISFFMDYALEKKTDETHKGIQSIERCVYAVTLFFSKLIYKYGSYVTLRRDELYKEKENYTGKRKWMKKKIPDFQIRGVPEEKGIFRDIPTKVFQILMNLAVRYSPDIALAIGLQAFGGLRLGEVCNVRQEASPKGAGILFAFIDGRLVKAEIDLTHEYAMRSDGVVCGNIKKEQRQCIYLPFLEAFQASYKYHLEYLKIHVFETEYCPMFISGRGMAMIYDDYYQKFDKLIDGRLRPMLLEHPAPECRIYGQMLCENRLGSHAL